MTPVIDIGMKTRGRMSLAVRKRGPGIQKMLVIRSPENWFLKRDRVSSKNTFVAGGSTYCMEVTVTGRSSPPSGELPTGAEKMDTTIWSGWLGGDFKLTPLPTTRQSVLILAYRTKCQRQKSQGRWGTCLVHRPIGSTTRYRRASSFIGRIFLMNQQPIVARSAGIPCSFPATFRDGSHFWHFSRYSGGGQYADKIDTILNRKNLDSLVEKNQFEVAYTHFGYWSDNSNRVNPELSPTSIDAFRLLKAYQDEGKILVAKTSRLLRYNLALEYSVFTLNQSEPRCHNKLLQPLKTRSSATSFQLCTMSGV